MNVYDRYVLPYLIDFACGLPMVQKQGRQLVPQAQGRVLVPGGQLLFCEHGRAPDASVRRWQDRLQPLWGPLAGGCHLGRDIPALLQEAGFAAQTQSAYLAGPRPMTFHDWGQAQAA
jgi:hypothetical protein